MQCWKLREGILDLFEKSTGGRIIFSVNTIGGVKRDLADQDLAALLGTLDRLEASFRDTSRVFLEDPSIHHRLGGLGVLTREAVARLGAVGPMARASGLPFDVRMRSPGYWDLLDFQPVLETAGDSLARCVVRVREVHQSLDLIRQAVARMPRGTHPVAVKVKGFPDGETCVRLEQPRGEVVYFVRANGTRRLERFRARTPTFANLPAMIELVKGVELADVASIILTIDPCISCTER
jgi:ech hydrogenase subunit E